MQGFRRLAISVALSANVVCLAQVQNNIPAKSADITIGQQIFSSTCAACHGLDGRGGEHAPNIATNAATQRKTDDEINRIIRQGIPGAGMPGFATSLDDNQIDSVLKYLRTLQRSDTQSHTTGDPGRGHTLFFENARCSGCHMIDGKGGFIGPDLSEYGSTHSPDAAREAILFPNKHPDARRGTITAVAHDGKKYTGIIRNEDNFSLQIQNLDGGFHLLDKSELARIERAGQSLMPGDFGAKLIKQQIDDLVSFLISEQNGQKTEHKDDEEP